MAKYSTYRHAIASGDLLIWSTRRWKTWRDVQLNIVRLFTRSEYDHVAVAWVVADRVFVVEATPPLVRIYPLEKLLPFHHVSMAVNWTPEIEQKLLSLVGEPYSVWQAIVSYFTKPAKDQKWQCVELAREFYSFVDLTLESSDDTPGGFVRAVLDETGHGLYSVAEP